MYEAGFGFECVSPGEVQHVLSLFPDLARVDPSAPASAQHPFRGGRLLFTPNFAPRSACLTVLPLLVRVSYLIMANVGSSRRI